MADILKGAPVASAITEELKIRTEALKEKGIEPTLAIVRVGARDDDLAYERGAVNRCGKIGIAARKYELPADCTQEELLAVIRGINADASIHGCLMFRPLPKHINELEVCEALSPEKDVDSITSASLISTFTGKGSGFTPCTAQSVIEILDHYGYDPKGKNITVIGRSLVIGKPVSMMLQNRNATVTMCHTKTVNMAEICQKAEILVVAAGKAGIVDSSYVSEGQVIIDVGINTDAEGRLCGDVNFEEVEPVVAAITPVPAGVGAVTTAVLAKHLIQAAEKLA